MRKIVLTTVLAGATALATVGLTAAPAGATGPAKLASSFLAGYQTTQVGISRATASLVAPAVACDPTNTQGIAFGVGNESSPGHLSLLAGVRIVCSGGSAQVFGYAFGGTEHSLQLGAVDPGDRFNILITQTNTTVTATATDLATHGKFRASGTPVPDHTLTFGAFPLESGTTPLPVPDFGRVIIQKPFLEDVALAAWSPTLLSRRNGATVQIATGAFQPTGSFGLTFKHT